jgi:hypothetical protein
VLAVVEHQQQVAIDEVAAQRLGRSRRAAAPDVERSGDLGGGIGTRGEINEPDPIRLSPDLMAGNLDRQPRLPYPAGTGQRHQPRPVERFADAVEFARAADQRRQRHWHVVLRSTAELGRSPTRQHRHAADHHTRPKTLVAPGIGGSSMIAAQAQHSRVQRR